MFTSSSLNPNYNSNNNKGHRRLKLIKLRGYHLVTQEFEAYPSGYSNWFDLIYNLKSNYYEVAVVGENALEKVKQINSKYIPNKLIIGSTSENNLPLLKNRFIKDKTLIYVCVNKACKMPTESIEESVSLINY